MKYNREVLLVTAGSLVIVLGTILYALVMNDIYQANETQKFIQYQNQDHKDYCEKAESRGASIEHLIEENCR